MEFKGYRSVSLAGEAFDDLGVGQVVVEEAPLYFIFVFAVGLFPEGVGLLFAAGGYRGLAASEQELYVVKEGQTHLDDYLDRAVDSDRDQHYATVLTGASPWLGHHDVDVDAGVSHHCVPVDPES